MKKILFSISLVAICIVLACVAGELFLRVYHKIRPISYFSEDKILRYRGKPHEKVMGYPLNSKGFKDSEHPVLKPKGSYRIVALGDSFAFGAVPYPENYLTILEELLNNKSAREFEVINMGIIATEPPQYLELLMSEGMQYNPDLVLVSLFVGNDFYLLTEKDITAKKPRSYLYTYLSRTSRVFRSIDVFKLFSGQRADGVAQNKCDKYKERMLLNIDKYIRRTDGLMMATTNPQNALEISINMSAIHQLKLFLGKRGVKLVIVLIPEEYQINLLLREFIKLHAQMKLKIDSKMYTVDFTLPNKYFKYIYFKDVTTIDIHKELLSRQVESSTNFYIQCDGHWNKEGNRAAAEIIYNKLMKLSILPNNSPDR